MSLTKTLNKPTTKSKASANKVAVANKLSLDKKEKKEDKDTALLENKKGADTPVKNAASLWSGSVQTSLRIGSPGGKHEKEADAVAEKVMNNSGSRQSAINSNPVISKKEKEEFQPKPIQRKASTNQISATKHNIQRGFLGNLWSGIKKAGRTAANLVSSGVNALGGALSSLRGIASHLLGGAISWAWKGILNLGSTVRNWLVKAGKHVWKAIKWFGNKAWEGIKWLGVFLWEKLSILGTNAWSFLSNIPIRLWRLVVHGWEGIKGVLGWTWRGLRGGAKYVWKAAVGVFKWLEEGIEGGIRWIVNGAVRGYSWASDFIRKPSLSKLLGALMGSLGWVSDGIKALAKWGWRGVQGAAVWAWQGISGFAGWIWDGIVGGASWAGKLIMQLIDLFGFGEFLQIVWGLIFRMRKLTPTEIAASRKVHPPGMIPYDMIRVDDNSLISMIGGAAVTTMHVIHVPKGGITISTMVHELTHVSQYEHVGSVYMPQAIGAQIVHGRSGGRGSGSAYDYVRTGTLSAQRAAGGRFKNLNRESQAELVQDYYNLIVGGGTLTDYQPFINDMQRGEF